MPGEAILSYQQMLQCQVQPDKFTYPILLKTCGTNGALREGEQIHCRIAKCPHKLDMYVQCYLIDMYSRCGKVELARSVFDAVQHNNVFCWNVMIDGYVKHGDVAAARKLFAQMPERDLFSWNVMIDGYAKAGQVDHARKLFDSIPVRDIVTWNSMIDGYARCGDMELAKSLFDEMPSKDDLTWGIMINGYAKCGRVEVAHNWLEKLPCRNTVVWNTLIHGYAMCKNPEVAYKLFETMPSKNLTSWNTILDAFAKGGEMEIAWKVFNEMPVKDVFSWNIMIDGCAQAGCITSAQELFGKMPYRDVVSWNIMIAGFKQSGHLREAVEAYNYMLASGQKPDTFTLAIILSAVADLGLYDQGRSIHAYVQRNKLPTDGLVGVALIGMYCSCGFVDTALEIFGGISCKSRDHWNAMLSGAATNGHGSLVLALFQQMEQFNVFPDDVTFIAILNACSHAGLVHEGHFYFQLMYSKYHIVPTVQHFGCLVDLLSRAGLLREAKDLVNRMPVQPNDVVWRALLSSSSNHGDTGTAESAAKELMGLFPYESSSYVLLSNLYGMLGQNASVGHIWGTMKNKGVKKTSGHSSVEVDGLIQ